MEMGTTEKLFFLYFILVHMVSTSFSQPEFPTYSCSNSGNYSSNSIYKANLDKLLPSVSSSKQLMDNGFYNFSSGQEPDKVNVIALCRRNYPDATCRSCVQNSTRKILAVCPNQKEAIGWYNDCMIRYSNLSIFGIWDKKLMPKYFFNTGNASDPNGFNQALKTLLDRLRNEAAAGNSVRKFAVGQIAAPDFETIYGLVQCTPDLSFKDCNNCVEQLIKLVPSAKIGARIFATSCNLRYEMELFYDPAAPAAPPSDAPPSPPVSSPLPPAPGNGGITAKTIVIIVVPIVVAIILVTAICIIFRMRKRKHKRPSDNGQSVGFQEATDEISNVETIQFDFETIKVATNDFSNENKLGQGGFGAVYKGKLSNGQYIAVKRLSKDSGQGDLEFKNEVLLVAKLQHRNLVRLLGFSLKGNERLLIYEFLTNASLDHFIFDFVKRMLLDWQTRCKIISGIARGLLYLHEDSRLRIIHRDLKASNILLDDEMNPKIADFGMARLFEVDETQGNTSRIVGTYGYMAPEYAMHGQFSVKSDVYSFGVLVLELVSGQRNNCFRNGENVEDLLGFAWKNWRAGTASNVIDTTLSSGSRTEMTRCIHIGLLCVQENAAARPSMASVVLMLNSHSLTLPLPSEPAFFMHSNINDESNALSSQDHRSGMTQSTNSQSTSIQASENEVSISDLHPR